MHPTLAAAIVAGAISVLGVAANMWIARQSRRAAASQLRFASALKGLEAQITGIRLYSGKIERFRVACWDLQIAVAPQRVPHGISQASGRPLKDSAPD